MGPLPWGGGLDSKPASLRERLAATQPGHFKTQFKFCLPATSHPPLNTLLTAVTVCFYGSNLKVAKSWNSPRKAELLYCLNWFIFTLTFSWTSTNTYSFTHDLYSQHGTAKHFITMTINTWDMNLFSKCDSWLLAKVCLTCQIAIQYTGMTTHFKATLPFPPPFKWNSTGNLKRKSSRPERNWVLWSKINEPTS